MMFPEQLDLDGLNLTDSNMCAKSDCTKKEINNSIENKSSNCCSSNHSAPAKEIDISNELNILDGFAVEFPDSDGLFDLSCESAKQQIKQINSNPVREHTNRMISHCLQYNQSYKSMEGMAKIINETPDASIRIPHTVHKVKKEVEQNFRFEYHVQCSKCRSYSVSNSNDINLECLNCSANIKRTLSNFFVYIPFRQQILRIIDDKFDEIMSYRNGDTDLESSIMSDVHDALQYKKQKSKNSTSKLLSFIINTDGAIVNGSGKSGKSVWAIQLYQNHLKPIMRFTPSNIIVVGLHCGQKPKMKDFFYPFMKELESIREAGGILIEKNGSTVCFMPTVLSVCCDLPAKSDVQAMTTYSGYSGCSYCMHPGHSVRGVNDKKATVRYTKSAKEYPLRQHEDFLTIYRHLKSKPVSGVKDVSCMIALVDFDLVNGFAIDYMHCVLLGVVKKMLSLWLDSENFKSSYYIKPKDQQILSNRIIKIRPTFEIKRKPRCILKRDNFKANEFRSLLLYYLHPTLNGLLKKCYIDHFQLLSSAIYTLLLEKIPLEDISIAEDKLNRFANEFECLYGAENVTMNMHLLRHMANAVRNLGPLWSQSAFGFETNNGTLVKTSSKKGILHSLAWKYCSRMALGIMKNEFEPSITAGGKKSMSLNTTEMTILQTALPQLTSHTQIVFEFVMVNGIKYGSEKSKKQTASDDYFVQTKHGSMASVQFYLMDKEEILAMIIPYKIVNKIDHLLEVEPFGSMNIISFNDIAKKMIIMKTTNKKIASAIPNRFEKT